jgi:CheY-like chemotaxis protein
MTTTQGQQAQQSAPGAGTKLTVLVAEKDECIRNALGNLLEGAGYAVARLEELGEAEARIELTLEPLVLVVGNGDVVDEPGLQHFTVVAATAMTQHLHVYFNATPEHVRVPAPGELRATADTLPGEEPEEIHSLLAVVATATATL